MSNKTLQIIHKINTLEIIIETLINVLANFIVIIHVVIIKNYPMFQINLLHIIKKIIHNTNDILMKIKNKIKDRVKKVIIVEKILILVNQHHIVNFIIKIIIIEIMKVNN